MTAIIANLIGAQKYALIPRCLRSALLLLLFCFVPLLCLFSFFPELILSSFLVDTGDLVAHYPNFMDLAQRSCLWMCLFFLFDGSCWVFVGLLTAAGDTGFILRVNSLFIWPFYVAPVYLAIHFFHAGVDSAWMLVASYSLGLSLLFLYRATTLLSNPLSENLSLAHK